MQKKRNCGQCRQLATHSAGNRNPGLLRGKWPIAQRIAFTKSVTGCRQGSERVVMLCTHLGTAAHHRSMNKPVARLDCEDQQGTAVQTLILSSIGS